MPDESNLVPAGGKAYVPDDLRVVGTLITDGVLQELKVGDAELELSTVKGIYLSGNIAVAVPDIADAEIDEVAVDVSALDFAPAIGDAVIAIPAEALMTSAILCGAYVSGDNQVTVSFAAKEGGAGVTGANKNFKFLFLDLT